MLSYFVFLMLLLVIISLNAKGNKQTNRLAKRTQANYVKYVRSNDHSANLMNTQ
jgi:hypothetical protein